MTEALIALAAALLGAGYALLAGYLLASRRHRRAAEAFLDASDRWRDVSDAIGDPSAGREDVDALTRCAEAAERHARDLSARADRPPWPVRVWETATARLRGETP